MNKKRWALLVLCAALVFGYYKLFYKRYSETVVAKDADAIIAIDVKRVINTVLWQLITTPSQWKFASSSSKHKDEVSFKDMVQIPDYVLAFHVARQPATTWYAVVEIKDNDDFTKGLSQYHFEKISNNQYASKELGLHCIRNNNQLLVSNTLPDSNNYIATVADQLFTKKQFIAKTTLIKTINAKSHVAVYISTNDFLAQDAIVTANFDKEKIEVASTLSPNKAYQFSENNFLYASNSLFNLHFTQPSPAVYNLLTDNTKNNISKVLNFNIDSVFLPSNKYYSVAIAAIKSRVDSAISYAFDDDFNKVEKVVVNNVQEPSFTFATKGDSVQTIFNYFKQSKKLEQTDAGELFIPIPFVKSYCSVKDNSTLNIIANNYQPAVTDKNFTGIFFASILLSKIPTDLLKYLPDNILRLLSNIESIQITANKSNDVIIFNTVLQKKKNDLPIIRL